MARAPQRPSLPALGLLDPEVLVLDPLSFYCTLKNMQTFKFKSQLQNKNIITFLQLSIIITVKNNKP